MKPFVQLFSVLLVSLSLSATSAAAAGLEAGSSSYEWPDDIPRLAPSSVVIQRAGAPDENQAAGFRVNVLQDCWTNDDPTDIELETYIFAAGTVPNFVWKHKIFEQPCFNYLATIVLTHCKDGKPSIGANLAAIIPDIQLGGIDPGGEWIISVTVSGMAPGVYDWFLVVECNDTNGTIPVGPDGDIDDVVGANLGLPPNNPLGPVMYGPEPVEILDPSPGGSPPGRWAGEEGATRCWCFEVI